MACSTVDLDCVGLYVGLPAVAEVQGRVGEVDRGGVDLSTGEDESNSGALPDRKRLGGKVKVRRKQRGQLILGDKSKVRGRLSISSLHVSSEEPVC
jgi:hypothetical protein